MCKRIEDSKQLFIVLLDAFSIQTFIDDKVRYLDNITTMIMLNKENDLTMQ